MKRQEAKVLSIIDWPAQFLELSPLEFMKEELHCKVKEKCPASIETCYQYSPDCL